MALPTQVQKQADEAEALAKQLAGEQEEPAQQVTASEEPVQEQGGTQQVVNQPKSDEFEQKYRTLQGIFNAEKQKANEAAAQRDAEIERLRTELQQLKEASVAKVQFGTDEDRANFGDDFVQLVERGVDARTQEYRKQVAELKSQLAQVTSQLQQVGENAEVSRYGAFIADLDNTLPGWRQTNSDPAFIAWLNEVDPISGMVRNDILVRATRAFDLERVRSIFEAYQGKTARSTKQPTLAQQVSPTRGHSSQAGRSPRVYTEAQIAQFYNDWRKGVYTDEQAKAIEHEIEQAYAENRII